MIGSRQRQLGIAALAITVAGLVYYVAANWASFGKLSIVKPAYAIPLVFLLILDYFVLGLITKRLTQPLGLSLGISEAFLISTMTGFYNMVLPFRGGMATRALYLKTRHGFTYTNFLASLSAGYVLIYLISGLLGLVALFYTLALKGLASTVLFLTFSAIVGSLLFVVLFSPNLRETRYEFLNRFIRVANSWRLIKQDSGLILATAVLSLFQILLETTSLFLQFKVFGMDVGLVQCLFLDAVGSVGQLIQITPAGLGVNEALILFSAQAIAVSPAAALAATLVGRAVGFLVLIVLGPLSSYVLLRHVRLASPRD